MSDDRASATGRYRGVFELLGKRWTGLIVVALLEGPARFSELARAVDGVSERMLAERLNELVAWGLAERKVIVGPPIGVEYELTPGGLALRPALEELLGWSLDHLVEPVGS